jgi:hypothetical protein
MNSPAYRLLVFVSEPHLNKITEAVGVADFGCMLGVVKHKCMKSKMTVKKPKLEV